MTNFRRSDRFSFESSLLRFVEEGWTMKSGYIIIDDPSLRDVSNLANPTLLVFFYSFLSLLSLSISELRSLILMDWLILTLPSSSSLTMIISESFLAKLRLCSPPPIFLGICAPWLSLSVFSFWYRFLSSLLEYPKSMKRSRSCTRGYMLFLRAGWRYRLRPFSAVSKIRRSCLIGRGLISYWIISEVLSSSKIEDY